MRTEDLQALGLDTEQIKAVFELNGKDVNAEKKNTAKAEADRDKWKEKAEEAERTLKSFDGVDVEKLNQDIANWKAKAEQAESEYRKKIYERDFADALNTELEAYTFTSDSAKWAVTEQVKQKNLPFEDGKILGLKDLIEQIKARDSSAFASDEQPPTFTHFPEDKGTPERKSLKNLTLDERIKLKNSNPDYYNKLKKGE